jgi:hypothetical protein
MNKFKFYFILSITTLTLFSCSKNNDSAEITPPREYPVQYATDITDIEEYLNTYYITVTDNPGAPNDQDVEFTKIPAGGTQPSIMSYKDKTTFPKLLSRDVKLHDITYKLYYLVLREGTGVSPSNVDNVLTSYNGGYLEQTVNASVTTLTKTQFEEVQHPQQMLNLFSVIRGWKEIFPQFRTGSYTTKEDGTVSYRDFGAGIMFIPSGLGYYASGSAAIPAYAPLVFSFKLYEIQRVDHEYNSANNSPTPDGILSYQEDLDGDGYLWTAGELPAGAVNPDDSDGDGIPNFLDVDDDGDGYGTRSEITKADGTIMAFDAIPSCDGNTTNPSRIKKHLDKSCH